MTYNRKKQNIAPFINPNKAKAEEIKQEDNSKGKVFTDFMKDMNIGVDNSNVSSNRRDNITTAIYSAHSQEALKEANDISSENTFEYFMTPSKMSSKYHATANLSKGFHNMLKKSEKSKFKMEEMLIVYYAATAIRLSMLSDASKAMSMYKKK